MILQRFHAKRMEHVAQRHTNNMFGSIEFVGDLALVGLFVQNLVRPATAQPFASAN
jgi:hypothetical protein